MANASHNMISLREFSELAGVSTATASRLFSDPDRVAPRTRTRLLKLADSIGFRPSAIGRTSFGGATRSVGVLLPSLGNSYFADIALGLQERFLAQDYLPMILQEGGSGARQAVRRLLDHRVDAIILHLVCEEFHAEDFSDIVKAKLPVVLVGAVRAGLPYDSVDSDDVAGGRIAAQYLLERGHRRMGFVRIGAGHTNSDLRLAGFREGLGQRGIVLPDACICHHNHLIPNPEDRDARLQADLAAMLRMPDRPTAIFASTDLMAKQVYSAARSVGLHVPRDLSVLGYANLNFCDQIEPALTSISQKGRQIGHQAADLLLQRLDHPDVPRRDVLVPTRLIERKSVVSIDAMNRPIE